MKARKSFTAFGQHCSVAVHAEQLASRKEYFIQSDIVIVILKRFSWTTSILTGQLYTIYWYFGSGLFSGTRCTYKLAMKKLLYMPFELLAISKLW